MNKNDFTDSDSDKQLFASVRSPQKQTPNSKNMLFIAFTALILLVILGFIYLSYNNYVKYVFVNDVNYTHLNYYVIYEHNNPESQTSGVVKNVNELIRSAPPEYARAEADFNDLTSLISTADQLKQLRALGYEDVLYELRQIVTKREINTIIHSKIPYKTLNPYLEYSQFNFDDLMNYEDLRGLTDCTALEALNFYYHPYIKSDFYEQINPSLFKGTNLVLVNKNYRLNQDYVPKELVTITDVPTYQGPFEMNETAYTQFKQLYLAAKESGYEFLIQSAYRSYERQEELYEYFIRIYGKEHADLISARPGHSEHQTGLSIDVNAEAYKPWLNEDFGTTAQGKWIKEHAHEFGYIIRYPKGKENTTGYSYEPWHLRYVGKDVASVIYNEELTFEDYLLKYEELN